MLLNYSITNRNTKSILSEHQIILTAGNGGSIGNVRVYSRISPSRTGHDELSK